MVKIVIVGANHAGTAAANTILDNYPGNEVVIFDRNSNISYLGCGTALWIGKQITEPEKLFYCSKDVFEKKGAKVFMETEIKSIDYKGKKITGVGKDGKEISETFDKIILATGSIPIIPNLPGINLENVHTVKLYQDAQTLNALLETGTIKKVAIVGAGYIGVELAEAMKRNGCETHLFECFDTSLATYYDPWFTKDMDENLKNNGINLHFGQRVQALKGDKKVSSIVTDKGEFPADLVILSIGFRPNSSLAKEGNLELFPNGAIKIDRHQQSSLPHVYAIGDCATVFYNATQEPAYIALATNAVRSGIVAGHNVCDNPLETIGVQGSNGISIFGLNMVSTGLNLCAAKNAGYDALYTEFEDFQKPGFIPAEKNSKVKIRIVYDSKTRRVLGAQLASRIDISMGIHMFSLAIEEKVTIDKLKLLDIFFLPHFNQPYNYITMAALGAK